MESALRLPVLFLPDQVVLPGMVVPLELDDSARSAIDTARAHADERLIVAPRLADRYPSYGVEARVVQLGRTASGTPAAVVRAEQRVKIGSGVAGAAVCGSRPPRSPRRRSTRQSRPWPTSTAAWRSPCCNAATPGR